MATGTIDGGVRDKVHAAEILAEVLPLLPSGAVVRVTRMLVKVDMSRVRVYTLNEAGTGRGEDETVTGGLS